MPRRVHNDIHFPLIFQGCVVLQRRCVLCEIFLPASSRGSGTQFKPTEAAQARTVESNHEPLHLTVCHLQSQELQQGNKKT